MFTLTGTGYFSVSRRTFDADSAKFSGVASYQFMHKISSINNLKYNIWAADVEQNIYLSTDGGMNWSTRQVTDTTGGDISAINDIHFTDEQNGWFCSNSAIYHSNDGGANWHYKTTLLDSSLSRIYFKKDEGWVMGEKIIYHSSDEGDSWQEQYRVEGEEKLVSISFVNLSNGWALSESGNVYRYGIE